MKASIIVVNWNTRDLLKVCLRSIERHAGDTDHETIVIDNASEDGSAEMTRALFPAARLISNDQNLGFARAVNQGVQAARGTYCVLLNPDAELLPEAIQAGCAYLETHPEAAIAGAQLLNADGSPQNSIAPIPRLSTELFNKSILRRLFPRRFPGKETLFEEPIEVESVIGAFMVFPRNLIETIGLLDEGYFLFLEETDFCLRARRAGRRVMHLPSVRILHHQGAAKRRAGPRAKIAYHRSRYRFFRKFHPPWAGRILAAGTLLRCAINLAFQGALCLGTLFAHAEPRRRLRNEAALLLWHLKGRPDAN
jgi:GT2 family glycosyltransferase